MDEHEKGQVVSSAAEVYESLFVPALFGAWAEEVASAAAVSEGQRVLDVACGTGVLTRAARGRVGPDGEVVGLDRNAGMLTVARRTPGIDWREGVAEALPFDDGSFDAVVSQFGLMFFDDRAQALREMRRVLRPGGTLAIAVWGRLEDTPGYLAMAGLLERLFGEEAAASLRAPYCLGEEAALRATLDAAGLDDARIEARTGEARFSSVEEWVHTDIRGWTLAGAIDDAQYETLLAEARTALAPFVREDGSVAFAAPALITRWG